MKPDFLPLFRDAGRLLMHDFADYAKSRAERACPRRHRHGKQAMRSLAWPNARWWRNLVVVCQDDLPESRHPDRDRSVFDAWTRLAAFRGWDAVSFADAIFLLIETSAVETFGGGSMPERHGDPRPFFGDRACVRDWLVRQSPLWDPALDRLLSDRRLSAEEVRRLRRHRPTVERCPDPHALVRFRCTADLRTIRWEERTVRSTLAYFRSGSLRKVRLAAALVEEMMAVDERDISLVQRFLAETNLETAAPWLALVSAFRDRKLRRNFLERLAASEERKASPHRLPANLVQTLERRARRHGRDCLELAGLFTVVKHRLDPVVLEEGLALAESVSGADLEVEIPTTVSRRPPLASLVELGRAFVREDGDCRQRYYHSGSRLVLRLWNAALGSREFCQEMEKARWSEFPQAGVRDWARMILNFHREGLRKREFSSLVNRIRRSILAEAPERCPAKARVWRLLFGYDPVSSVVKHLDDFEVFAATVAGGFQTVPEGAVSLFDDFYRLASVDQRWSLATLSRSVIKNLEEAARNDSHRDLIKEGARIWFAKVPEADPGLHFRRPKRFLDTLLDLASLPKGDQDGICGYLRDHPGFGVDPRRIDLRDACFLFDTILRDGENDPVPGKLRDFACGRVVPGAAALAHYRDDFADRLADYQINLLRGEIARAEARYRSGGLDPHTIRFVATLGSSNRRAMKRFLRAFGADRSDYRETHPANVAWLEKHRHLKLDPWTDRGTEVFPVDLPGLPGAFVRLEDDAQESLKMGTHVSSCLSLGGCNQHAVVANVLDVNKRIAYLRDGGGRILARQLLAISEQEDLVPFSVYLAAIPLATDEVERVFKAYDTHLAGRLGLPLWKSGNAYEVRPLLARDWYDDCPWSWED